MFSENFDILLISHTNSKIHRKEKKLIEASSLSELSIDYTSSQKDSPSSPQDSLEIQEVHHKILCKVKMYGNAQ